MKQLIHHQNGSTTESANADGSSAIFFGGCQVELDALSGSSLRVIRQDSAVSNLYVQVTANTATFQTDVDLYQDFDTKLNSGVVFSASETGLKEDTANTDDILSGTSIATVVARATGSGSITFIAQGAAFESDSGAVSLLGGSDASSTLISADTSRYMAPHGSRWLQGTEEGWTQAHISMAGTWRYAGAHLGTNSLTGETSASMISRIDAADGNQIVDLSGGASSVVYDTANTDTVAAGELINWFFEIVGGSGGINIEKTSSQIESASDETMVMAAGTHEALSGGAVRFFPLHGNVRGSPTESVVQHPATFTAQGSKLGVFIGRNTSGGSATHYTCRIDGVDGNQTVTLTGIGEALDTSNTDDITDGDQLSVEADNSAGSPSNRRTNSISMVLTAAGGAGKPILYYHQMAQAAGGM
jgi:hypothetical protein